MHKLKSVWHSLIDIREGEAWRTAFMSLYLLFVMFAYYILKPVSRAMFLTEFKVDRLPYLNMLIAAGGGLLAYLYSKLAIRTSLERAVSWAMGVSALCLVGFWWLVALKLGWMLYVFNVWVSLFSIVLVSQGWLVAANVFDARSAKRLYGLLGLGAVLGAAFGGSFTALTARLVGSRNLLLASVAMVALAYAAFRCATAQKRASLGGAKGAEGEGAQFTLQDVVASIGRSRHLQLIVGIITLTFIVGVLVEFQFQAMASLRYKGDQLAAFFGTFQGIYQNLVSVPLQFLATAALVRRLGVGGTLRIMPTSLATASVGIIALPGLATTMLAELTESATRYTVNRTGMELLYLPLPADLRNRTKAFVDVCMDRMGRGLGGALLALLLALGLRDVREISVLVMGLAGVWIFLCVRAQKEYLQTVRGRFAQRRLELDSSRLRVNDPATLALLEEAATGANPRQACYAVSMLAQAPDYDVSRLLIGLAGSSLAEVRAKAYEAAETTGSDILFDQALAEIRSAMPSQGAAAVQRAVTYVLSFRAGATELAREFLAHDSALVTESALEAMRAGPDWARELIQPEWVAAAVRDPQAERRRLAAVAVSVRGDTDIQAIQRLLKDRDPHVLAAACRAAGALRNRSHINAVVERLGDPRVRRVAIEALASYGAGIAGTLGDLLADSSVAVSIRRQIPRVLKLVPDQRNVEVLLQSIGHQDISIRAAVLKALNRLREQAPELNYGSAFVTQQILNEARHYFELHAALAPFGDEKGAHTATGLLARTIAERCAQTIARLFWLLGLRYPQREIHAAYRAMQGNRRDQIGAALDYLENVLDHSLRRVVLPLLESSGRVTERGRDLFGVEVSHPELTVRELIRSSDPWLVACAMATAVEQKYRELAGEIAQAAQSAGPEVRAVAHAALTALGRAAGAQGRGATNQA
jgi:ATP/ADP translocase